jgi:hypothetical protein
MFELGKVLRSVKRKADEAFMIAFFTLTSTRSRRALTTLTVASAFAGITAANAVFPSWSSLGDSQSTKPVVVMGSTKKLQPANDTQTTETTTTDAVAGGDTTPVMMGSTAAPTSGEVVNSWGAGSASGDVNGDGVVDAADLAAALNAGTESGVIMPIVGNGFDAATTEPDPMGLTTAPGFDARAMARWNFVPHQTMAQPFNMGLVAFHSYGVNRVEFSVNDGPWTAVTAMKPNPESATNEYWIRIDPRQLPAGEVEVRAVVYPNVGKCRVLGGLLEGATADKGEYGMFFVADPNGTAQSAKRYVSPEGSDSAGDGTLTNPFASIMKAAKSIAVAQGGFADNGVVYLLPGEHCFGNYVYSLLTPVNKSYLTITPAPGIASSAAPITSSGSAGINVRRVHFADVTFKPVGPTNMVLTQSGSDNRVWLDRCTILGFGRQLAGNWSNGWHYTWQTNCYVTATRNGFSGELVRNCMVDFIASDAYSGAGLVVGSYVRRIDRTGTDFHPDVFQLYAAPGTVRENHILYRTSAIEVSHTQGLFAGSHISIKDIAFVEVKVATNVPGGVMRAFQFGGPTDHMLVQDCDIAGPAQWRPDLGFVGSNIVVRNSLFTSPLAPIAGVVHVMDDM